MPDDFSGDFGQSYGSSEEFIPEDQLRPDKTRKGKGFFGELKRPDGTISTELSIGVDFDGKEQLIPSLVPTLSKDEVNSLLSGGPTTPEIIRKAVDHARMRRSKGLPYFAQEGEQPISQQAEQAPVEYQPLYSQDEEASFIQAGLSDSMDHYTSGLQKQTMKQRQVAAKLRQQAAVKAAKLKQQAAVHPVWKVGEMLQKTPPTDAQMGWSKPLGGEWQSTTGVSTTPVQLEQATILEQQAGQRAKMLEDQANEAENQLLKNAGGIPLSNMQVARNFFKPDGTGIWNQIVKNAGNKPLDNISFYESPYWDELRNNGASDAAIEKLQNTVGYLAARAHLFKAHNNRLKAQDFYKEMQADPDVKPFMDADAEILHNPQAIGSATWYSKMSAIKQKAAFLKDNDDARELFDRLKSGDKEDQMQYAKLLLAPSAQGFIGRLAKYQQDQDRRSELKGKLTEWVDAHFKGVEGEEAATLWKVFQEKVNAGKYKTGSDLMADFKNALSPTLKEAFGRKMVMDKLGETEAAGNDLNSLHIQFDANKGSFKILTLEKALPLIEKEKNRIFGNTDILKSGTHPLGSWVELPVGTFTDESGKPVFPTTPGKKISPFTYVDGEKMYVNKKMLKALGLANVADLVDPETGEFKTKTIPKEQMSWMTDTPTPFISNLMNGEDFSKGIYKIPTEKSLLDKGFAKKNDLMFGGRTQMDWQDILFERAGEAPQRASLVKELLKTVPRVAVETVAEIGGMAHLPVDVSKKQALIMEGVFHSLAGDVDAANAAYSQYFSKTLDRTYTSEGIKDALYGGNWAGTKKYAANPEAPTWMKTTVGVVEGIENVAAFVAEAALGPSVAAGKVISGVSKVERMAGMLGKLGANMASLEGLAKTGSAVFASERWFNAAKIVNGALHDAILFPLVDALFKGEGDTEKLLESALGGAAFGAASRVGKGITLPFFGGKVQRMTARPVEGGMQVSQAGTGGYRLLPSAERVAASIPGVFGLEALKQTFAGKTPDQILASIDPSTPEGVEKISEITQNWIWTLLGAHDITKLKSVEEKGRAVSKEAKPETPVASKEEFVQTHAADASAVGSANEVKNVIKNPEELPSERVEAVKMVAPEVYASDAAKLSEQIAEKQAELKNLKGEDNKLARLGKENEIKVLQEKTSKIQEDAEKAEKQEAEVEAESNKVVEDLIDEKKKPENINDVIEKLSKNVKERTKVKVKDNGVPQTWAVKEVLKEQKVPDNQLDAKAQEIVDGLEAKAATAKEQEEYISVYHGTPHEIGDEGFQISKIGTGEGAQVYGHGSYQAENFEVADKYRKKIAYRELERKLRNMPGVDPQFPPSSKEFSEMIEENKDDFSQSELKLIDAIQKDDNLGFDYEHQAIHALIIEDQGREYDMSDNLKKAINDFGNVFESKIPKSVYNTFIDWNKPLSQQGAIVQELVKSLGIEFKEKDPTGKQVYKSLGNPRDASGRLNNAGIKGIKYFDKLSRIKGEGTFNFVVFDPSNIKIAGKKRGISEKEMEDSVLSESEKIMAERVDKTVGFEQISSRTGIPVEKVKNIIEKLIPEGRILLFGGETREVKNPSTAGLVYKGEKYYRFKIVGEKGAPSLAAKLQTAKTGKEVKEVIKAGEEIPDEVAGSDAWKNVPEQDMPIFAALHRELTRRIEAQAKRFGVDWVDFLPEEGKKSQGGEGKYPGLALARAWPQFVSKWLPSAKGLTLDQLKASHLEALKEAHQNIDPATRDRLEFLEEQLQYAEEGKEQESLQKTIDEIKKEHHLDVDNAHKTAQAWLGDKAVKDTLNKSIVGWMNAFADTAKLNYKERTGREPQKISEAELAEVGQEIVAEQKEVLSEVDHAAGIDMAHSVVIDMAETNPRILDILLNATDANKLRNNRPEKPLAHLSDQEKKAVKAFAKELGANLADPKFGLTLEQIKQIAFEAPAEILATVQGNISKQLDGFKSMDDVYKAEPMLKGSKNENVREYLDELKNTIEGNVERNKAMEAQKNGKKVLEKSVGKGCVIPAVAANLIGGINA